MGKRGGEHDCLQGCRLTSTPQYRWVYIPRKPECIPHALSRDGQVPARWSRLQAACRYISQAPDRCGELNASARKLDEKPKAEKTTVEWLGYGAGAQTILREGTAPGYKYMFSMYRSCTYKKHLFCVSASFYLPSACLFSRSPLRGTQEGRVYTAAQVWAPAGLRVACSGRSNALLLSHHPGSSQALTCRRCPS